LNASAFNRNKRALPFVLWHVSSEPASDIPDALNRVQRQFGRGTTARVILGVPISFSRHEPISNLRLCQRALRGA
jgi:hypothetical protein